MEVPIWKRSFPAIAILGSVVFLIGFVQVVWPLLVLGAGLIIIGLFRKPVKG